MNLDQFLKWFWKYKAAFPTIFAAKREINYRSFDSQIRNKFLQCGEDSHTLSQVHDTRP